MKALFFILILWLPHCLAAQLFAADRDHIYGTENTDIIYGDLGEFAGRNAGGFHEFAKSLHALTLQDAQRLGTMLEMAIEDSNDGDDIIFGLGGDDVIFGQGGNDRIDGGEGADIIFAGSGNDIIKYDPMDKVINGGSGMDILIADFSAGKLGEMLEVGHVQGIEALLKIDNWDMAASLPGLEISSGRILPDSRHWELIEQKDRFKIYVFKHGKKMLLEIAQ